MARNIQNVKVTVEHESGSHIYTAPLGVLSGVIHEGVQLHAINLSHSTHTKFLSAAEVKGYSIDPVDDERKKLIAAHTARVSETLQQAETSRLQEEAMRIEREAEAALQKARSRRKIMIAVHAAIQAGLSVEEVTADMEDGFSGYVHDMFDQVYVLTDLDTVVNVD